jgi:hypothetical protein
MARARVARQWFSVLGPPVAVFLQQQLAYVLVQPACLRRATLLLQLPALAGLAVTCSAGTLAWREWTRAGRRFSTDGGAAIRPDLFFGLVGLAMGSLAMTVILAQWLPTLFLDPCQH